jgi:energy-converting hydrogenase B subunit Q
MARRPTLAPTVAVRLQLTDRPTALPELLTAIAAAGGTARTISTVRRLEPGADAEPTADPRSTPEVASPGDELAEIEVEVEGLDEAGISRVLEATPVVRSVYITRSLERVFGKRVIVIGGGAQVAQVALGAVSEADRHNLRGERISVDTIALVGEENIAAAVRAVADLPRARMLVLAGSIMGGDITDAARELRAHGIPVIALNMAGSITEAADLVVSDPVQAGTMAVMAIADTATFDLARQRGRRY